MGTCAGLGHPIADGCLCGLVNANAQGFTIDLREWGRTQNAAMDNLQSQATWAGHGQASQAAALYQAIRNSNAPTTSDHHRPCDICGAGTCRGGFVKATDGSLQWVDMCDQCYGAAGASW